MNKLLAILFGLFVSSLTAAAIAEGAGKSPILVDSAREVIAEKQRGKSAGLPAEADAAVKSFQVRSVPYWAFQFSYQGTTYGPESVVGKSIFSNGGTSVVSVPIIPVKFRFPAYVDATTGQPVVLDGSADTSNVLLSPNFFPSQFSTGFTQYQDAAQRASFYGYYADTWHTLLQPRVLNTVTIDVPADKGHVYQIAATGTIFAIVDVDWFWQQQIHANSGVKVEQLPIFLTHNIMVYYFADPVNGCCVQGWHGAYVTQVLNSTYFIQTHVWGAWYTADVLGADGADVNGLTHEIAEWMNDPFVDNFVPRWDFPQGPNFFYPAGVCEGGFIDTSMLEVADPLEFYFYSYHIQLNGYTYHVANQALAPWFLRDVPSTGIHGAYSFPDETLLTGPSPTCL